MVNAEEKTFTSAGGTSVTVSDATMDYLADLVVERGFDAMVKLNGKALFSECAITCNFADKHGIAAFCTQYSAIVLFEDGKLHHGILNVFEKSFALT
jgi:hypothetical protein